ncbi:MAG: hypothetical protein GY798_16145 [Hyphomicrobiales bacterium]|nr:hypothetical protein [Hyphomicrobiales bacterium]
MNKTAAIVAFYSIVGVLWMFATAADPVSATDAVDDSDSAQFLYSLSSKSGTFEGGTLTLSGVPRVVYFSDRPKRVAGHMALEKFLEDWDKGIDNFAIDPPNAELAIHEETEDKHVVLIIERPSVHDDRISFKVKILDETIPDSFGHATLFIDVRIAVYQKPVPKKSD